MTSIPDNTVENVRSKLRHAPLLLHVGTHLDDKVIKCHSWDELLQHHDSLDWVNANNTEANRTRDDIRRFSPAVYNRDWNNFIEAQWPWYDSTIRPIIAERCPNQTCADAVNNDLRRLFTMVCLEIVWKAHMTSFKHHEWLQIVLQGHTPCGWVGEYPEGKLIVF